MRYVIGLLCFFMLASCSVFRNNPSTPKREFRGVWIATVANIDWPKDPDAGWETKEKDYNTILDFYDSLNFNAVIVQVRTAGDALYPTEHAPWSRYLTGKEGRTPEVQDPLHWMIRAAHQKGFEFHAWLNPYRATMSLDTTALAESHDLKEHPEWVFSYGNKYYYNPGIPEVREKLVSIMEELVLNYPIDAIHFDDYFYPYKIEGEQLQDSLTYQKYALQGQSVDEWRRSNVDSLVKNTHLVIKKHKPWVQFGISPFGVWKNNNTDPKGSDTRAGQTTYEDLYADPLLWMEEGWIDYLIPQLYWSMDFAPASHRKLVDWWTDHKDVSNLYIGNAAYKVDNNADAAWSEKKELNEQITYARNSDAISGNAFFSAKSLMQANRAVVKNVLKKIYPFPALPPVSPLSPRFPAVGPQLLEHRDMGDHYKITLTPEVAENLNYALIYKAQGRKEKIPDHPRNLLAKVAIKEGNSISIYKENLKGKKKIVLSFLDRYGKESQPIFLHLNQSLKHDQKR